MDTGDDVLIDEAVPVPYQYERNCNVLFTRSVPQTVADRFRAEFTQHLDGGYSGPRVIELDGLGYATCGDANDDGMVTATDAPKILSWSVGGNYCAYCLCDATNDQSITATGALAALRGAIGQTENLNCPSCNPE